MSHALAGQTVKLKSSHAWDEGTEYRVEDTMRLVNDNPRTIGFITGSMRMEEDGLKADMNDDDLLYGKIGPFGYIVHASEVLAEA
jgi:hypothetical protein